MSFNFDRVINFTGTIFNVTKKEEALCNEVYFVDAEKGKFILKIAKGKTRKVELDKEYNLINELKEDVCLPQIYLYEKEKTYSFILMEFIDGKKPTLHSDKMLKQMATTLKKIHNVNASKQNVDLDKLIKVAEDNMINNKLDLEEFVKDEQIYNPKDILKYLKENKPKATACLLHGDYRPKNLLVKNKKLYVLDWGLSFVGDPYYDLAIIKWYFTDDEFVKFIKYYGIENLDTKRLEYNEWLSAFLNV